MDWRIVAASAWNLITVTNIVRSSYGDHAKNIFKYCKKLFNLLLKIFRNHRSIKWNPNSDCAYFIRRGSFSSSHFSLRCFTWLLIFLIFYLHRLALQWWKSEFRKRQDKSNICDLKSKQESTRRLFSHISESTNMIIF